MHRITLLVLAGLVIAASSYQMLASDSFADQDRRAARHELEIASRNAAIEAFTEAKHLVERAQSLDAFTGEGRSIHGSYESAVYRAHIVSDGVTVMIYSSAWAANAADTVDFAVTAEIAWQSHPGPGAADRYLVLRAYHEE